MPQEIERAFEIGHDSFGRRVTLSRRLHYTGKVVWKIVSHPLFQTGQGDEIDGLSDENIHELSIAAESP